MNQIISNSINGTTDKTKFIIVLLLLIISAIICFSTIFTFNSAYNENIINNVFIAGIDVSNKTIVEAKELIQPHINSYSDNEITLVIDDRTYKATAKELGFVAENMDEIVENAYEYGRKEGKVLENNFAILFSNFKNREFNFTYNINDEAYEKLLAKMMSVSESIAANDEYEIKDDSIIITKGRNGLKIDKDTLKTYICTAIVNNVREIQVPIIDSECEKVNFEELYESVYVEAQDASYTSGENFEIIVEKDGRNFNIESAKMEYEKLKDGESMTVTLETVEPKVKVTDLNNQFFKDILAICSTTYDKDEKNRVKNLKTASDRCNGTIVYPGKEFSFHNTIGTRTTANGYALAHSFANGKVVDSVGGGICQVSSNLYKIVLMADLEVTERTAHGMYVTYVEPSLDATISEGVFDFKFKNNKNYPIMIESIMNNGTLTMSIKGIKEDNDRIVSIESVIIEKLDYSVVTENDPTMNIGVTRVVQDPVEGYISEAYKIIKDSSGNEISKTLISKDKYIPTNKIIKIGTKEIVPETIVIPAEPVPTPPTEEEETPIEETPIQEPERELPPGWDSPESPYGN